ncbi:MAG: divergent PAP2 family protein [Treponema sp.]|nr:divergent PAP2 family protein [Treponema sp.]
MFRDFLFKSDHLKALFENMIFLSSICSLCTAQLLKSILYLIRRRKKKSRELIEILIWRTGGMPSSHAALVSSLCTSTAFIEGIASNLFVFSFWFALVVLRDAMGVRRSAGLQARALNNLGKQAVEKMGLEFHTVKEIQGHTPLEVVVGASLGIFIAAGLNLL